MKQGRKAESERVCEGGGERERERERSQFGTSERITTF